MSLAVYAREVLGGSADLLVGLGVTFKNLMRKKVTFQYPELQPEFFSRYRGIHGLTRNTENDDENCIGCLACAKICPDQLITMTLEKREGHKGRFPITFEVDLNPCCFCGLCAEVCPTPEKALLMTKAFELASESRQDFILRKEDLLRYGEIEVSKYGPYYEEERLSGKPPRVVEASHN